jgi:hypothetical protein
MVDASELTTLLQRHGWYLSWHRKWNKRFAYAKKREGKAVKTRYLIAESKLGRLTVEEVLKRLQS